MLTYPCSTKAAQFKARCFVCDVLNRGGRIQTCKDVSVIRSSPLRLRPVVYPLVTRSHPDSKHHASRVSNPAGCALHCVSVWKHYPQRSRFGSLFLPPFRSTKEKAKGGLLRFILPIYRPANLRWAFRLGKVSKIIVRVHRERQHNMRAIHRSQPLFVGVTNMVTDSAETA